MRGNVQPPRPGSGIGVPVTLRSSRSLVTVAAGFAARRSANASHMRRRAAGCHQILRSGVRVIRRGVPIGRRSHGDRTADARRHAGPAEPFDLAIVSGSCDDGDLLRPENRDDVRKGGVRRIAGRPRAVERREADADIHLRHRVPREQRAVDVLERRQYVVALLCRATPVCAAAVHVIRPH